MTVAKKTRELTEQQKDFIEYLLGEAKGDYKKALRLAGYSENTRVSDILKTLRNEIVEASLDHLALNAPRAAHELTGLMDNPIASGATTTLKVAQQVLDRVGVSAPKEDGVNLKVPSGGLFIMPAKEVTPEAEEE